jgi:hypothetical protein
MKIKLSENQFKTVNGLITQELARLAYLHYNAGCDCGERIKELRDLAVTLSQSIWEGSCK